LKKIILPVAILACSLLVFYVLIRNPQRLEPVEPEQALTTVRVVAVETQQVNLEVSSQGRVQASRRVSLSAAATGPVAWISPSLVAGGYFESGQVILRLDSSDYQNTLERSRSSVDQAEADALHAMNELQRNRELAARRLISESQIQDLQRQSDNTAGRVRDAKASLAQAELDFARSEIRAPFATIVESSSIELGQHVNRGQVLASLLSADEVEVRLPLAISQLGYLDIPLGFRGELPPEISPDVALSGMFGGQMLSWKGRLVRTEAGIDASNNTVQAVVRVLQPVLGVEPMAHSGEDLTAVPLPVGLYVNAAIKGRSVDNIVILPRSVIRGSNRVVIVDAESRLRFRELDILRLENERVLIQGGLRTGERVLLSPLQAIVEGMSVQVIE